MLLRVQPGAVGDVLRASEGLLYCSLARGRMMLDGREEAGGRGGGEVFQVRNIISPVYVLVSIMCV